jgi:hypothetical protein
MAVDMNKLMKRSGIMKDESPAMEAKEDKFESMVKSAAMKHPGGGGKKKGGGGEFIGADHPYYDNVVKHLGYDTKDKQTRRKIADYMAKSKLDGPGMIAKHNTPDKVKSVRSIIDNYDAFTPDTSK